MPASATMMSSSLSSSLSRYSIGGLSRNKANVLRNVRLLGYPRQGERLPSITTAGSSERVKIFAAAASEGATSAAVTTKEVTRVSEALDESVSEESLVKALSNVSSPGTLADSLRHGALDPSGFSFKEKFLIRCYEVGMNGTASPETMANLLQEVACNHAQSVGFSTDGFATTPAMRKKRLIWVTTRMHIEVLDYPVWGDALEMETWCQCEGKAGTRRDWMITDVATGKLVGRATSTWVMMNQDTRRISRVTGDILDELLRHYPVEPRYAFPEENSSSLNKIPKLEDSAQYVRSGLVPRRGDLDMNQHVNNVTYIGWVLESIPESILDTHQLYRITLEYRRECNYNDVVESFASLEGHGNGSAVSSNGNGSTNGSIHATADELVFLHIVRLSGCHIEINRARTVWRAKAKRKPSFDN